MMTTRITRSLITTTAVVALSLGMAACGTPDAQSGTQISGAPTSSPIAESAFFTTDKVHSISVDYDDADYQAMVATFKSTGDKGWIKATVTIDGTIFNDVGLRLKGNSSLQSLRGMKAEVDEGDGTIEAESPQSLPWLIRLDKYVEGQEYSGRSDFVVRGNNTESSLNEAVALAMLEEAGVPAQQAAFTKFAVNGSEKKLRLVVDVPDDQAWTDEIFGDGGNTYKADSDGDYSYRGDDPSSYSDVFSQRTGPDDMTPVMSFLDFINNSTDADFEANLDKYLDTEAFASYLVAQDLIGNFDDIDGPGNNSYLHYDPATGRMTVVAWDHNLAFGASPGAHGDMGRGDGLERPEMPMSGDLEGMGERPTGIPPEGFEPGQMPEGFLPGYMPDGLTGGPEGAPSMGGGGMPGKSNPLVERFEASPQFAALVEERRQELTASVIDSGFAQGIVDDYVSLLKKDAADVVSAESINSDAQTIQKYVEAEAVAPASHG